MMSDFEAIAHKEKSDVFPNMPMPTDAERLKLEDLLKTSGVPNEQTNLFRFNLNIRGIAKLAHDGAAHLHDVAHGTTSIRGYMIRTNSGKMTIFWPGGLGFHNRIAPLLQQVFPEATLPDPDKLKLLAKGPGEKFELSDIKEFDDVISYESKN